MAHKTLIYIMDKTSLKSRLERMRAYLLLKVEEEDWHGVADTAMDIREIVAQLDLLKELEEKEDAKKIK